MTRKLWFGFLQIPEGKSGKFEIRHRRHKAGRQFNTASARTAIFGGHADGPVRTSKPGVIHELAEGGGVWMTDLPIEQAQIDALLKGMRGRVLVGGLGLGYAAQALALRKSVTEVIVIEKSPEVDDLVTEHLRGRDKIHVVTADLHEWLKHNQHQRFDWAFHDIWQGDGETTFWQHVAPLRKLTDPMVPNQKRIRCWNEDVMRGQMTMGLQSRLAMLRHDAMRPNGETLERMLAVFCEPGTCPTHNAFVQLFAKIRDGILTPEQAMALAPAFVACLGLPNRTVVPAARRRRSITPAVPVT